MNVLLTGGSRGIGAAIALLFKDKGHYVYAPSRDELDLTLPIRLDTSEYDIIINNAGINTLNDCTLTCPEETLHVNFIAPLQIIQQCLPYMMKERYGRIVNIGSVWIDRTKKHRLAYSASKSALHALTKALAVEYSNLNILANTVSPGFVDTEMTHKNNTLEQVENIINTIPCGRLGLPEEIAKTVYHLTIDNTYISGQNIIIDGGFTSAAN